jgi:DNA-binding GntR family transcriptional regulator
MAETVHRTKEEQVAEFLREGIVTGRFPRGARLKQLEIAGLLDISPTPVREAMRLLEAEGYLQSISHKGMIVAPFDVSASREILDLRVMLECHLLISAMDRLERSDVDVLCRLHDGFMSAAAAGDRNQVRSANYQFHRQIYELAGQQQTMRFVQTLWAKYPFDIINRLDRRIERAADEHSELLEAILAGDRIASLAALRKHIQLGWDELRDAIERGLLADASHEPLPRGRSSRQSIG